MNLNLLDITIIVILAFYLISGMYRGFITSMLGTLGFVGAWFGAQQLYPQLANLALSNQTLMAVLSQYLEPETFFATHNQAISQVSQVIAGGGMSEEQREALMLSNLSNVLLMSNRSTLSFYMACLACQEDPQSVSAVVSLVTHLRMHGYLEEALDVCVIGLQMDPQREELYIHAGNIYIQLDNPDAALGYFNRCLTNCGFSGQAYQGMMAAYLQQNNYT